MSNRLGRDALEFIDARWLVAFLVSVLVLSLVVPDDDLPNTIAATGASLGLWDPDDASDTTEHGTLLRIMDAVNTAAVAFTSGTHSVGLAGAELGATSSCFASLRRSRGPPSLPDVCCDTCH